jgi:DNA-binding beta-propeller fold protein YncE
MQVSDRARFVVKIALLSGVLLAVSGIALAQQASTLRVSAFQADAQWPSVPNGWVLGEVSSVAAGPQNHIWVLHRPNSLPPEKRSSAPPPVLEFDTSGKLIRSWGGLAAGYEWPDREHAIHVDSRGFVWITGNAGWDPPATDGRSDDMILKFTSEGKFVLQIGRRGKSVGNTDTSNVHQAADVFVHTATNELFVADGYGNQRIVVFDADTGRFKRMWGAFGNVPPTVITKSASQWTSPDADASQFGLVHAVEVSSDGIVYVADRTCRRIQTFTVAGRFLREAKVGVSDLVPGVPAGLAFSPGPEQRLLYVIDSGRIAILDRRTLAEIGSYGQRGQFGILHHMAADAEGSLYTADVRSQRAQRFVAPTMKR